MRAALIEPPGTAGNLGEKERTLHKLVNSGATVFIPQDLFNIGHILNRPHRVPHHVHALRIENRKGGEATPSIITGTALSAFAG